MAPVYADFEMPDSFRIASPRQPPISAGAYRDAMSSMAAGACLVTARHGDDRLGRTVTSVFSLSLEPPAILVSIDIASPLVDLVMRSQGFSFAVLAAQQQALAEAFAGHVAPEQRFDLGFWQDWPSGQPRLLETVLAMDCELVGSMETGSHVLFAGAAIDIESAPDREPLIWHRRHYTRLAAIGTALAASA